MLSTEGLTKNNHFIFISVGFGGGLREIPYRRILLIFLKMILHKFDTQSSAFAYITGLDLGANLMPPVKNKFREIRRLGLSLKGE